MRYDYLNTNTYKAAFHAFRNNMPMIVFAAAALLLLEILTPVFDLSTSVTIVPELFLDIGVAFAIHSTILTGKTGRWREAFNMREHHDSYKPFMWKSFTLFLLTIVIMAILGVIAYFTHPYFGGDPKVMFGGLFVVLLVILGLPLIGLLFAVYGTILPAAVAGVDSSFPAAFHRSKGLFWYTFGRMFIGPVVFQVGLLILTVALSKVNVPFDAYLANGSFDLTGAIVAYILYATGLFSVALTATVLCKTYLKSVEKTTQSA